MKATEKIQPVKGAAEYIAMELGGKWSVLMFETKRSSGTVIETYTYQESAEKAAIRWQKKENKAVLKNPTP